MVPSVVVHPHVILFCQRRVRVLSCSFRTKAHLQHNPGFERRTANYTPTIWDDKYIQTLRTSDEHDGTNKERICKLKKQVSQMIHAEELLGRKLELVDALQQLGVAYHFEDEISSVLYASMDQISLSAMRGDLYEASLLFRLLRMHGFNVEEDVFKSYFDKQGHCEAKVSSDVKGMLNLYEASYLAKQGEEMLETARHFTTKQLTEFLESGKHINSWLKEQVAYALDLPLHWRMERQHTRWFIDQYKANEHTKPALRELAVLDFNLVQNLYKKELKHVSRWWAELGLYKEVPFIRDRLVENYLWTVGTIFEPEHSRYRIAVTQANCLITTIDDIYDVYGSLDELEVFTDAIEKWDFSVSEGLNENLRKCILALFNTVEDQDLEVSKKKGLPITPYLRQHWKNLCRAYLVEARWYHNGYTPTLEEYLKNACISISGCLNLFYTYFLNENISAKDLMQYSSSYRDIVHYSSMLFRLYNDLGTSSDELGRGDVSKSVECYMHEKGCNESVARQEMKKLISKYWTLMNSEVIGTSSFEMFLKKAAFNLPRTAQWFYQHGDGYAKPYDDTKDIIISLFFKEVE